MLELDIETDGTNKLKYYCSFMKVGEQLEKIVIMQTGSFLDKGNSRDGSSIKDTEVCSSTHLQDTSHGIYTIQWPTLSP